MRVEGRFAFDASVYLATSRWSPSSNHRTLATGVPGSTRRPGGDAVLTELAAELGAAPLDLDVLLVAVVAVPASPTRRGGGAGRRSRPWRCRSPSSRWERRWSPSTSPAPQLDPAPWWWRCWSPIAELVALVAIALVAAVVAEHVTRAPARPGALVVAMLVADRGAGGAGRRSRRRRWWSPIAVAVALAAVVAVPVAAVPRAQLAAVAPLVAIALVAAVVAELVTRAPARPGALDGASFHFVLDPAVACSEYAPRSQMRKPFIPTERGRVGASRRAL